MHNTEIIAALNAWKAFFLAGKDAELVLGVDTLAAMAKQSQDTQLQDLAELCLMLEASWDNGARQANMAD